MLGDLSVLWLNKDPCGMSEHLCPWGKTSGLQYLCLLLMVQDPAKSNKINTLFNLKVYNSIQIKIQTCTYSVHLHCN